MQQASIVVFGFAMALYAGATVLYAYFFLNKRRSLSWYATFLTGAGFLMHTASILIRWVQVGHLPIEGPFDSLSLAAWALVLIYFVVEHLARVKILGVLLVPAALVAMTAAWLNISVPGGRQGEVLDSWTVGTHVTLIMLANAGFAIGAAASIVYLLQERQLKQHKTNLIFRRLPSLAQTDAIARKAVAFAYPAYTAALLLGVLRAVRFVEGWYFDPRVMMAGIVWLIFGAYLVLRYRTSTSARSVAWIAVVGLAAVVLLSVLARFQVGVFHNWGGIT